MSRNPRRMGMGMEQRHQQQRPSLNPWEGGFAPGSGAGGGGLLPTPPVPSLLSQFSSPEAQLAVASNLLTSLLRPVQNNMQSSNQVPSLMSIGTSGSFGGGMHQHQQSYHDHDNYSSRGQYNDYSDSPSNMQHRSFDLYRNCSPVRIAPKRNQQSGRARQGRAASPQSKSRTTSSSDRQQREVKREQTDKKDAGSNEIEGKKGAIFEGLPKAAFHCHICKKNMWDAVSFHNHVGGMAHQRMLTEREKSYMVKADLMRHDAKLEEQQNQIEIERLIRMGKKMVPGRREFCKMCDFTFFGDLGAHRKSKIHQNLKNFLHPKCSTCQKEFALRLEMDKHLLTADHLKKVFKDKMKKPEGNEMEVDESKKETETAANEEEEDGMEAEDIEMPQANVEDEDLAQKEDIALIEEENNEASEENQTETDTPTGETSVKLTQLTSYDPDKAVGQEFLMPVTGMFCKACRRFFLHEDHALQTHCRTLGHFNNCLALSNQKEKTSANAENTNSESSNDVPSLGKRPLCDENAATEDPESKRSKPDELYDPLDESPPTPEVATHDNNETPEPQSEENAEVTASKLATVLENIDNDLDDLINEIGDDQSNSNNKAVVHTNAIRAKRGRYFRGRGRGVRN